MGYIDVHSHILPGADDGARDMRQSMEMLRIAEAEGIAVMFATPHYKSGRYRTEGSKLETMIAKLQQAVSDAGLQIRIYPGTEIFYRTELEEDLQSGRLLTMNGTSFVLLEFSPFEDFAYMRNAMEDVLGMGYWPILAHVERYQCMLKDKKRVRELRDIGCGIQANAGSIVGDYGFAAKFFLWKLLKEELVDYIGTDAHNAEKRCPAMQKCADMLYRKCRKEYADALLYGNAWKNFGKPDEIKLSI